jgi:cell division protein FtsX
MPDNAMTEFFAFVGCGVTVFAVIAAVISIGLRVRYALFGGKNPWESSHHIRPDPRILRGGE